jgi:hypothetical protein
VISWMSVLIFLALIPVIQKIPKILFQRESISILRPVFGPVRTCTVGLF